MEIVEQDKKQRARPGASLGAELTKLEGLIEKFAEKYQFAGNEAEKISRQAAICRETLLRLNADHANTLIQTRAKLNVIFGNIEKLVRDALERKPDEGLQAFFKRIGWRV